MNRSRLIGIALVLVAAFSTACMGLFIKEALERGSEALPLLAVRYVLVGLMLGVPLVATRMVPANGAARKRALATGLLMFLGGTFEIRALEVLPLSVVIVILFLSPLWIALYSRLVRGDRFGFRRQLAFLLVFVGIVSLVGPALDSYDVGGLFYALGSSFVWAAILLLIQGSPRMESDGLSPSAAIASGAVVAAVVALLVEPAAMVEEFGHSDRVLLLLGTGIGAGLGFGLLALGMRNQHVFDVAVVSATEPLFAAGLAAIFLDERLSALQLFGVLLVALGVVLIASSYEEVASADPRTVDGDDGRPLLSQRLFQRRG